MPVRIKRIKINREGPLNNDFLIEPVDLNLVYGPNETGKTCIVEAIIRFLFKSGTWKNSRSCWESNGKVIVTGLKPEAVSFTKTSSKLEDYWEENRRGLPQDFSRLLIVRAGETNLSASLDGIGMNILKDYLSGERMLDEIENRISKTIQTASVEKETIKGIDKGEIKNREETQKELKRIDNLVREVDHDYAAGSIYSLQKKKDQKEADLADLKKAKQYHASLLYNGLQDNQASLEGLPSESDLADLERQIGAYTVTKTRRDQGKQNLEKLGTTSDDYTWTEQAMKNYQDIINRQQTGRHSTIFIILTWIFFIAAVSLGLFEEKLGLGLCAAAALIFFVLYSWDSSKFMKPRAGDRIELKKLEKEFQKRFKKNLSDRAAIEAQLKKLEKDHNRAEDIRKDILKLDQDLISSKEKINGSLRKFGEKDITPDNWQKKIKELRNRRNFLETEIHSLEKRIASLGVPKEQFLYNEPGLEWDPDRYSQLETEKSKLQQDLNDEINKLESLKSHIALETRRNSAESWEDLLTALYEKRKEISKEYKEITAEILAKIQVYSVIKDLRKIEILRIKEGLKNKALTDPLFTITGRYNGVTLDNGKLILSDLNDESFDLADMSTGAREQVFLALRLGFTSISMKGETGFLILDDAFQHSDWDRRKNLVQQTLMMIKTGWQIFYFTMDNNIKDLFLEAGKSLGDGFNSIELG